MKLITAKLRAFLRAKRGNVAMIFAIAVVPIAIAAGVGLDFARAMLVRQQMGEALDAAALAVGSTTGLDATSAQALAQKFFDANYTVDKTAFGTPTIPPLTYNANGSVTITATSTMPTILMKVVGFSSIPVSTTSTVVWGQTKLWVSLVLDNSGSMCRPDNQPCLNDANTASKIYQLKDATKTMLTSLQGVSATAGDVKVAIVPFNREVDVGIGNVNASWIYWGFWELPPPNSGIDPATPDLLGPNDGCPWSTGSEGYTCQTSGTNGSSTTNSITSGGLICPSIDNGRANTERNDHYYNGCYTSVATGNTKQVSSGSFANCNGYANCTCAGNNGSKKCNAKYYNHVWTPNAHSTWGGCITDRAQDYDVANTAPSGSDTTGFPADNPASPVSSTNCMYGNVTPLEYDWTDLATKVNAMQAKGSTNQAVGVAHGWMAVTNSAPYSPGTVPANTTRYIILFSDGLNTQNRWWGDGSTEGTTDDAKIDAREKLVCDAAKADGVVVYSIYIHVSAGEAANSPPLQDCATDSSKYYNLTSSAQIATAFADITKKITNVRVSR